jgi:sulfur carrier protein
VSVDGQPCTLDAGTSVAALLEHLGHAPTAVAVAVNGEFVARAQRAQRMLRGGDQVTCFKPIVGG